MDRAELALSADELMLATHTGLRLEVRRLRVRRFNGRVPHPAGEP